MVPAAQPDRADHPGGDNPTPVASPLIDPDTLAERLGSASPPVLLDVRWTLAGADRDAYRAGHLPGAVFVDLDADLAGPPDQAHGTQGRHPLPEPAVLQVVLRRAGVHDGTPVVVYGQQDASSAARAWWLLRWAGLTDVAVLDGGYRAWTGDGRPVQAGGGPAARDGTVTVRPGGMPVVDADGAASLASGAGSVLLDARAPERYRGETEPIDPVAGHIPGAANLPLAALHEPDGRLRAAEDLAAALDAAGAGPGAAAAASCGSGVTACVLVLAGELVGRRIALYPGSYSGWCALGRPVQSG